MKRCVLSTTPAAACAVKLWAAIGIVAMLVVPPRTHELNGGRLYGVVGTGLVLWLPVLIPGPGAVLDQVLGFQLTRPGDETMGAAERLGFVLAAPSNLIHSRHVAATLLGGAGLIVMVVWRRRDRLHALQRLGAFSPSSRSR